MLNDSGIEIKSHVMERFIEDSMNLLDQLKQYVLGIDNFKKFGHDVELLMNSAYAISLNEIGELARYGKEISFKSERVEYEAKLFTIQSLLSQLVKKLEMIMRDFRRGGMTDPEDLKPLLKRLAFANDQLGEYV